MNKVNSAALPALLLGAVVCLGGTAARSDEAGVSMWLPGTFGSMAAVPTAPGWSAAGVYYHTSLSAGREVATAREVQIGRFTPSVNVGLSADLNATGDLFLLAPTYTFATPVLGGQASVGFTSVMGRASAGLNATLSATIPPFNVIRSDSINDSVSGVGDLYPVAKLKWNQGVNNWMIYATGDIPVGAYNRSRIINLGIGHGAIDLGGGYTYFNPKAGSEFSVVMGFTENFKNTRVGALELCFAGASSLRSARIISALRTAVRLRDKPIPSSDFASRYREHSIPLQSGRGVVSCVPQMTAWLLS